MLRKQLRIGALVAVLAVTSAPARAAIIDFEGLLDGDAVTNQFSDLLFANALAATAGVSLNAIEFPPKSGLNAVLGDGGATGTDPFRIDLLTPITSIGGYFTYSSSLTLAAYNAANVLLGSVSSAFAVNILGVGGDPGSTPNEFLQVAFANMAYVLIEPVGEFVLDDLTYELAAAQNPLPEPALSGLLLVATGVVLARRRQRGRPR